MGILDVKIVQDYIRMCTDGWEQGWHCLLYTSDAADE